MFGLLCPPLAIHTRLKSRHEALCPKRRWLRYCGKYRFDQKDGFGILTEANGTVHEGFWSNGQLLE